MSRKIGQKDASGTLEDQHQFNDRIFLGGMSHGEVGWTLSKSLTSPGLKPRPGQ
jgi:hypothetical protein